MNRLLLLVAAGLATTAATAQTQLYEAHTPLSTPTEVTSSVTVWGRATLGQEIWWAFFDGEDSAGWGYHAANSDPTSSNFNTYKIDGIMLDMLDIDDSTPEGFIVGVFAENPANPSLPPSTPLAVFNFMFSGTGVGGQLFLRTNLQFPNPVFVPRTGGVFITITLPPARSNNDAMLVGLLQSDNTGGATIFDVPNGRAGDIGHGLGSRGGFGFLSTSSGNFFLADAIVCAPLCEQHLFMVGAITNQASLPSSNPSGMPGFTSSPFSGRNPALLQDLDNNQRADDLQFVLVDQTLTGTELIYMIFGLAAAVPIDLASVNPGWSGILCIDIGVPPPTAHIWTSPVAGTNSHTVAIPSSQRAGLIGLDFTWQALTLNFSNGSVVASACHTQGF